MKRSWIYLYPSSTQVAELSYSVRAFVVHFRLIDVTKMISIFMGVSVDFWSLFRERLIGLRTRFWIFLEEIFVNHTFWKSSPTVNCCRLRLIEQQNNINWLTCIEETKNTFWTINSTLYGLQLWHLYLNVAKNEHLKFPGIFNPQRILFRYCRMHYLSEKERTSSVN